MYIKQKRYKILGFFSLVSTTLLWGTSFAFIKLSVGLINTLTYTFTRTTLASLILLPIILYRVLARGIDYKSLWYGFIVGLTYSTGLALQGAGNRIHRAFNECIHNGVGYNTRPLVLSVN